MTLPDVEQYYQSGLRGCPKKSNGTDVGTHKWVLIAQAKAHKDPNYEEEVGPRKESSNCCNLPGLGKT
jgi:hypothetical protein